MIWRFHNKRNPGALFKEFRVLGRFVLWLGALPGASVGCALQAEAEAERICEKARGLEETAPRAGLETLRRMAQEMPTAGTAAAARCLRPLKERMGRVRTQVTMDRAGDPETLEGCSWAVDAMEVFAEMPNPPFKMRWARRLMERCAVSVGRAWTRAPDDPHLRSLHERLVRNAEE